MYSSAHLHVCFQAIQGGRPIFRPCFKKNKLTPGLAAKMRKELGLEAAPLPEYIQIQKDDDVLSSAEVSQVSKLIPKKVVPHLTTSRGGRCFRCKRWGHHANVCWTRPENIPENRCQPYPSFINPNTNQQCFPM